MTRMNQCCQDKNDILTMGADKRGLNNTTLHRTETKKKNKKNNKIIFFLERFLT